MGKFLHKAMKRVLGRLGYSITHLDHPFDFEALLYAHLKKNADLFFVQIGACEGISFDPLYQFVALNHSRVRGIVVEPLDDHFKELQANYQRYPHVLAVHAAIHNSEKEMTLYRVDPAKMKDLPKWAKGIASFNKRHHGLSGIPSDAIIPQKVRCVSLDQLLKDHQITRIDLLHTDTEGYDAEIILNIDFDSVKPGIIRFEHGLREGIMSKETFLRLTDVLHRNGYELALEDYDATAYQPSIIVDL